MTRGWSSIVALLVALTSFRHAPAADASDGGPAAGNNAAAVEFIRVHVPAGRIGDLPFEGDRWVPMPVAEFERAAARFGSPTQFQAGPRPLADAARYTISLDDRGRLGGMLEFDVGPVAAMRPQMPLGRIDAAVGVVRTADGSGEAAVFGLPDGGIAMRITGPGTYRCRFTCPPRDEAVVDFELPLVPALATRIQLTLPEGLRPRVTTGGSMPAMVALPAAGVWTIDLAAAEHVGIEIVSREAQQPRLRVWNRVVIRGGQSELTARVVPDSAWAAGAIALRKEPGLQVTKVRVADADAASIEFPDADPRRLLIDVPASLVGTTLPIDVMGVAETTSDERHTVPIVRPAAERWAGGGIAVAIDTDDVVESVTLEECVAVAPEVGGRWPIPPAAASLATDGRPSALEPAPLFFEQQSAAARVALLVRRRITELDAARITTVEISAGAVLGRAACDIRVVSGEAFEVTAQLGPGWFIDSVEAVDWVGIDAAGDLADEDFGGSRIPEPDPSRAIDWRVVRSDGVSELRIGLAEAATRSRALGLRIKGHRQGVPVGGEFVTADMDMVRLQGESAGSALVEFRVGPEAVIEVEGTPIGLEPAEGRLAALVEPGSPRGRIHGGDRAPRLAARLVRRRPPLDATARVQLVARDGRLFETFTFTCRPDAGDIDAIVVHFSEPLGEAVEWSLVEPAGGGLLTRRLGLAESERGDLARLTSIQDSWLVEFRPAIEGPVTFRGSRSIPFLASVPVPLAWVEGATEQRGMLVVRSGGSVRPHVINRRLSELPPTVSDIREATGLVTDMAYGAPATVVGRPDDPPAAELVPADAAEARAWVWRETTTAWCHDSGRDECETAFDIENRGRDGLTLTVPRGLRLEELFVDGESLPFEATSATGGEVRIGLPPGRGRLRIVARGIAERSPALGMWRIDPVAYSIDVPVLDQRLRLMMPPDLEVAEAGLESGTPASWIARLFDAATAAAPPPSAPADTSAGFRRIDVPSSGRAAAITVVRRRLIASTAIVCGLAAAALMFPVMRWRPSAAVVCVIAAAIAALWLDPPLTTIARATWWGTLAGVWCAGLQRSRRVAGTAAVLLVCGVPVAPARGDEAPPRPPYRVMFMTEDDAGTALVPEPLFRLLADDDMAAAEAVRVQECRLLVTDGAAGRWRLLLDIDADRGGVLVLDQGAGRWELPAAGDGGGRGITVRVDGPLARIVAAAPGRQRVVLEIVPEVVRLGSVETSIVRLPPAPRSTVEIADADTADATVDWQCECGDRDGPWRPVVGGQPLREGYDVSRAARVRLSRSTDPRHPLTTSVAEADSVNDLVWRRDSCLVKASYDIAVGRNTIRSVVVRTHPRLEPLIDPENPVAATRLGEGRYLVEFTEPAAGLVRLDVAFVMPLVDPVGVFEVPSAWLEDVGNDTRMVRCAADADFDVIPELPAGLALMRPREEDGPGVVAVWRPDAVASGIEPAAMVADQAVDPGERQRPRLAVRRRPQPHRVNQRLEVDFAPDHVGLRLDCQIDAMSAALTEVPIEVPGGATVDRLTLVSDTAPDATPVPVDIFVSQTSPTRIVAVLQQPRCGRFHLLAEVLLREPPSARGRMPLARCTFPDGAPLAVTWQATGEIDVEQPAALSAEGSAATTNPVDAREVSPGDMGPAYALAERVVAEPTVGPRPAESLEEGGRPLPIGNVVESTTVHMAIDRRGRGWGLARFDLAAAAPVVQLRLPPGMRLFDLLVDGRETQATPVAADAWDVTLHDIQWPRSMVAVFAGDVGGPPSTGAAIRFEPPRLEGLPCREVSWTIDAPEGMRLRVAEPATVVDAGQWLVMQEEVRQRMAGLFAVAVTRATGADRKRLEDFAASRADGDLPPLESAWLQAIAAPPADPAGRVHVVGQGLEGVTIRVIRRSDDTTPARGLVTVGLVALLAVGWSVAGRWPAPWSTAVARLWPWAVSAAGGAWVLSLSPALPGWALLAAGIAAVATRVAGSGADGAMAESGLARAENGR